MEDASDYTSKSWISLTSVIETFLIYLINLSQNFPIGLKTRFKIKVLKTSVFWHKNLVKHGGVNMIVGYARVSTDEQNLDLQIDALNEAGCERIYEDKISGSKTERAGLDKALNSLRKEDTLIVWKLDRLGRSLQHLISIIIEFNVSGIYFKSLKESLDTSSSTGKLIFHIFGALAEFERDIIRERTMAGLAAARARGRVGGRPKSLNSEKVRLAKTLMKDNTHSVRDVCMILGVSKATLYRYLKE